MRLLGSAKQDIYNDKNREHVPKFESVQLFYLVNSSYQHASKVLFTFVPNE